MALAINKDVRGGLSDAGEYANSVAPVNGAEAAEADEDARFAVRIDLEARSATEGCVEKVVCMAGLHRHSC